MTTAEICQEIQAAIHTGVVYSRCANNTICSMSKKNFITAFDSQPYLQAATAWCYLVRDLFIPSLKQVIANALQ